jgi:hypothetical protein
MNINEFKNPGNAWRGKPFWSWNGRLEKDELLRQIDVMKEMGMGGFFMHSRTGLETEYLGDEWFELINACADYAESIGMEAWLYDEDRWPSGLAGGIVSQHPEFRQKAILLEVDPQGEGKDVVAEFRCRLNGICCTEVELLGTGAGTFLSPSQGAGKPPLQVLRFSIVEQGSDGFYNGYTYIDTMNRAATEAFLKCTHEKYAEKCGGRLGKSIKGIFTDEPHRGALLCGFSMYRDDGAFCAPYTPKLFDEFEKRFGYDLKEKLPELFLQVDGQRISQVKWHYVELLQQLFLENFAIPCKEWCDRHHLMLTGHVLHEDNLTSQTAMAGSLMRYYEHMHLPGVDVLGEHNLNYWIVKQLASAARQLGRNRMLSELYGCTGWQMPFAGHKAVGDWQALLGINLRCHHLSWYTMRGEAKRDYPASILHQSAWYKEYRHVEDYFARFGLMMAQGEPVCDLLVINPVESVWAQVHLGWSERLALKDEHIRKLEERYQTLFKWLLESQIDFDYGDEEMMGRMGQVEGGLLKVGCASYSTVLVSGMDTIRSSTLKLLDRFVEAGGKVIIAGDAPTHVDGIQYAVCSTQYETIAFTKESVSACVPPAQATVSAPDIFAQLRKTDDGLIFAALNVNRTERRENATVKIKTDRPVFEWNCETGEISAVDAEISDGWKIFTTDFPKGGQKLWVAGHVDAVSSPRLVEQEQRGEDTASAIQGPFDYTLTEPNICVLDAAEYRMDGGGWQPENDVLKIDQAIRDAKGVQRRGGNMLQPWFAAKRPAKALGEIELKFGFEIESMPEWMDLVLEEPENFAVEVNGNRLDLSGAFRWLDSAFSRVQIPLSFLQRGGNSVLLKTRYTEKSNLEAIYLLGNFGVQLNGTRRTLVRLPERLETGDLCAQGLPFYSGAVRYRVPLPPGARKIRLPEIGGACAKVNGRILGWDPFEAEVSGADGFADVEVVLTRRNTFGPLHDAVRDRYWVGPQHFITEGEEWTGDCVFEPSGLLKPVGMVCE